MFVNPATTAREIEKNILKRMITNKRGVLDSAAHGVTMEYEWLLI